MDGMFNTFKRIMAGALALGLALWAPGMPLALAQIDVGTLAECRDAFVADPTLDPAIRDLCLDYTDRALEAVQNPGTDPEADSALREVEQQIQVIDQALEAAGELEIVPTDKLQATLTQTAGVDPALAADIARQHTALLEKAKAACANGQVADVEAMIADVQKLYEQAGIDAKAVLSEVAYKEHGGFTFERVCLQSFEGPALGAPDFLGAGLQEAQRCGIAIDAMENIARQADFKGDIMDFVTDRNQILTEIQNMDVSAEERTKMLETFEVCRQFSDRGDFQGLEQYMREASEAQWRSEIEGMNPEQMAQLEAAKQTGDWTTLEGLREQFGMGPGPFAGEGPMFGHHEFFGPADMGMYHDYSGNVVTSEAMWREMAEIGVPVGGLHEGTAAPVENQNYNNTQETHATHGPDGHTSTTCPAGRIHDPALGEAAHCK